MVFILAVVNVFNYMDRMALSVLAPSIKAELHLSDGQVGVLVGLAFALFYAICGIPIARWADRGVRRDIVALGLGIWSVMTMLSGASQNFWHLFLARVGIGAGEAGGLTPAQSLLCDYVPLKRRPGVFALHSFGLFAGMMVGMMLAGWLGERIGWRWTFVALGLPGVALAAVIRLTVREPVRGFLDEVKDDRPGASLRLTLGVLWHCRTYRLIILFQVVSGFIQFGFYQWLPSFYVRAFELSLSSVGVSVGAAIGAGSGLGLVVGGLLANNVAQRDIRLPLLIGAVAIAASLLAAVGLLFVPSVIGSVVLVALTALLWNAFGGPVIAAIYSVTMPSMRATAGAISIFTSSVLGMGLGPMCVGYLSDVLTPSFGPVALRYALLAPVALIPVMALALYSAAKALPRDLRAMSA